MSDQLQHDIEALSEEEMIIGTIPRDDGSVVVVALAAFPDQESAQEYIDGLEDAEGLSAVH